MSANSPDGRDWWPPFDDVWQAASGAGCTLAALASGFTGTRCEDSASPASSAAIPPPPPPAQTVPAGFATDAPPPPGADPHPSAAAHAHPAPAVPGGLVGIAAAHPYSTAFLMGAVLTGSCLAGAAAANFAFKRSAMRPVPQITRGTYPYQPQASAAADARLARLEELLKGVQKAQAAQAEQTRLAFAASEARAAEASGAAHLADLGPLMAKSVGDALPALSKDLSQSLAPLATQLAELDGKIAAGTTMHRKLAATLDSVRETQRTELLTLRQEMGDAFAEAAKGMGEGNERTRQSIKGMSAALRDSVKGDVRVMLEGLEKIEKERAHEAAAAEAAQPDVVAPPQPEPEPTVIDINVEGSVAQLGEQGAPQRPSNNAFDIREAIDAMIAEVKAAEPQLAERLGAASAEWMMVKAIKAAEPYLSSLSTSPAAAITEGAGGAAAKLLRAVKAAEPFASRRMDAAAAVWNIVLTVKANEPRLQHTETIAPAEYEILRAIKAAEPHLVQDLDMGGAASKLLRAVKASEPKRPRYGSERAEAQILNKAKWSEPVLRRHPPARGDVGTEGAAAPNQGKPIRRVMATCSPLEDPEVSSASAATPPPATPPPPVQEAKPQPQPQLQGAAKRRRPSNQPVRNLGVTDSGEWKFTLLAPVDPVAARDGMQIQSREIMLSRESHRSWAGELLSLWHASHESACWSVGPFTTALLLNPDVDMVVLDGAWWRCSRDGEVYTVREKVADDAD